VEESTAPFPPHDGGLRMPHEGARHERTLVAWPCRPELWRGHLEQGRRAVAELARAVARFEPVTVLARPADVEAAAAATAAPGIEVVGMPLDDSWIRDTGPVYVVGGGRRVGCDFRFNGWGGRFHPHADDDRIPERWCARQGEERRRVDLVLEGGSIAVDGDGTLVTTEQCLLHPNRNPHLTRAAIEARLRRALGAEKVVWLPYALDDRDTDGHVDLVAACVRPGLWLFQGCDDPEDPEHHRLAVSRRCLLEAADAVGRPIEVVDLPTLPYVVVDGERLPAPYANLYLCNRAVVVPVTGHPADDEALDRIAGAFGDRTVVPVPATWLALGGGGPHCVTQQVPAVPADRAQEAER
jgi:agmatine deiminase